jgi:hypothetical protein
LVTLNAALRAFGGSTETPSRAELARIRHFAQRAPTGLGTEIGGMSVRGDGGIGADHHTTLGSLRAKSAG